MRSTLLALLLVLAPLVSHADRDPKEAAQYLDSKNHLTLSQQERDELFVLHDKQGHIIVTTPFKGLRDDSLEFFYYGTKKELSWQTIKGGGSTGKSANKVLWSPRHGFSGSLLEWKPNQDRYWMICGDRRTEIFKADDAMRRRVLDNAAFVPRKWQRSNYFLARDQRGVYYYVDKLLGQKYSLRLFVGRAGRMQEVPIRHQVRDSAGDLVISSKGTLRIDGLFDDNEQGAVWMNRKQKQELIVLRSESDSKFIYSRLGVYENQALGVPCDDI